MKLTTRLILAVSLTLALPGCTVFGGRKAIVVAADAPCTPLVPDHWRKGVAHTADPDPAPAAPAKPAVTATAEQQIGYWRSMYELALGEAKKWAGFGVSEAQRVEDANGRENDTLDIIGGCEKRNEKAVKSAAH